ncbi:DUF4089 domain-containing protein [Oscillatoria sp. CS-180]|uniref:DUF4089 domain-containing protein n=1 Tax=Oscillatoria sp. CS-180 TaxID=3021720 RepID=UPI00232CAC2E|nr:DUF4089 domain-containing protein [Oscillatoria sp. CS-180]MDB9525020.1 DUF4089 domain-containing protein [Oscillatoria sp. CS-180]
MSNTPHLNQEFEVQAYIDQMAALLDLPIPPEIRPGVIKDVERIIAIAQPLLEVDLPTDIEPMPTFKP